MIGDGGDGERIERWGPERAAHHYKTKRPRTKAGGNSVGEGGAQDSFLI
jgi:hypothetical protein